MRSDEHFYQLGLRQFGAFNKLKLDPAPSLCELLTLAVEDESGVRENKLDPAEVVDVSNDTWSKYEPSLIFHAVYCVAVDGEARDDGRILLAVSNRGWAGGFAANAAKGVQPESGQTASLSALSRDAGEQLISSPVCFVCSEAELMVKQVDWSEEKACFQGLLRELAFFYSPRPLADEGTLGEVDTDQEKEALETEEESSHQAWQLEHVLFPSFRRYTSWPRELLVKDVHQVANLPDLFRIFERC